MGLLMAMSALLCAFGLCYQMNSPSSARRVCHTHSQTRCALAAPTCSHTTTRSRRTPLKYACIRLSEWGRLRVVVVVSRVVEQNDTYRSAVQPLVRSCFEGINVTVMAYGQTGSGKTYTMGSVSLDAMDAEPGIIPQFVNDVFARIDAETKRVRVGAVAAAVVWSSLPGTRSSHHMSSWYAWFRA